jgi:two-component system, OmpR family, phosphate regulon sensor histidine kinase PhoR
MAMTRLLRALAAAAAAGLGLFLATSSGAPFLAALVAVLAGIIALGLVMAPGVRGRSNGPTAEAAPQSFLPGTDEVADAVEDPVMVVRDRRVLFANKAAKAVLGDHIEGVDVRLGIRHPAAAERLIGADNEVSRTELLGLGERDRRWEMILSPLPDGSRLVRLQDRSEAHASEQMRVDFVANASHELRTPLATLIGFSETLQDDEAASDKATRGRFLKIMEDEARRMQQLVDDLISLSRIEAERFSVPREPVPLLPLVEEVTKSCGRLIEQKQSQIVVEQQNGEPVVAGDRAQLLQLIQNLLVNALKYGRPGGDVTVRFEAAGPEMIRMSVIDKGEGIAPEHLPRLTERFYRIDPGRSRSMGGTGLGLAIVKHIVGRHRGRLDIASKQGEGSRFTVYLPALSSKSHATVTEVTRSEARDVPEAG